MSKTVTIPTDGMNPFVVISNGVKYVYTPGETVTVPDGVALEIEEYKRWREKYYVPAQPPFDDDDAGGGGGVQPDLSQNDPNAPDFVKNRTHYEEFATIIEEREVRAWFEGAGFAVSRIPQVGEKLTVTFNGETYKCVAWGSDGNVGLGNGGACDINEGENVPFFAGFGENDEGAGVFIATAITGENTISIVDDSGNTLLEETFNIEINVDEPCYSHEYSLDCSLIVGNTYKVVYDGVPYECVAWDGGDGTIGLGNGEIDGFEHSEDVPFVIGTYQGDSRWFWYLAFYGGDSHIVSVSEVVVHKLDPKYLPDVGGGGEAYDLDVLNSGNGWELISGDFDSVKSKLLNGEYVKCRIRGSYSLNSHEYFVNIVIYNEEDETIDITTISNDGAGTLKCYYFYLWSGNRVTMNG